MAGARRSDANLPIGMFDRAWALDYVAALQRQLPAEDFIYLGDMPVYPAARSLLRPWCAMRIRQQVPCCNEHQSLGGGVQYRLGNGLDALADELSASVAVVNPVRRRPMRLPMPAVSPLLATESTIAGGLSARAAQPAHLRVLGRACPLWATLAEQGSVASDMSDTILRDGVAASHNRRCSGAALNVVVGVPISGVS